MVLLGITTAGIVVLVITSIIVLFSIFKIFKSFSIKQILSVIFVIAIAGGLVYLLNRFVPINFKTSESSETHISWFVIVIVLVLLFFIIIKLGKGSIKQGAKKAGLGFSAFIIAILVSAVAIVLPLLFSDDYLPWWAMALIIIFLIAGIFVSYGGAENTTKELGYVFFNQVVKMGSLSLIAIIISLATNWLESWSVDSFWGGVGVFALAAIGIGCAVYGIKLAFRMFLTFNPIAIVNALAYGCLGFLCGVRLFTVSLDVCAAAAIIALVAMVPTGYAAGGNTDPYPLDINGYKAKQTGSNEYTTEGGSVYEKMQDGWGEDYKRVK